MTATYRDIAAAFKAAQERSKAESRARRERVFRHPDLRQRLCSSPLSYSCPERWSGWVPPRTLAMLKDGTSPVNTSYRRRALVEICAEALRREEAEQPSTGTEN